MTVSKDDLYVSPEDYLASERVSPFKLEYRNGYMYAIEEKSKPQALIALNLATLLKDYLQETGCVCFISDTKVFIEAINTYYYPDVTLSCDEEDTTSVEDVICHPSLIVEVLSETTEAFDRGDKFDDYQNLSSLQEYILISQDQINVESYRYHNGRWILYSYSEGEEMELISIHFRCPIAALYKDVPGLS